MKLNKKILLIIFILFIFFTLNFTNNTFAVLDVTTDEKVVTFPDLPEEILNCKNIIILEANTNESGTNYWLFGTNADDFYYNTSEILFYMVTGDDPSITMWSKGSSITNRPLKEHLKLYPDNSNKFIYTNNPILDSDGSLVFQGAPLTTTVLPEIMEQVEMKEVTAEILGVLPIVLIILVSLIAFWKGLSLLSRILHKS